MVILSDIDGLYDKDPRKNPDARLIARVEEVTDEIYQMAGGVGSKWGTGGMITKLDAARTANQMGIDMILTNSARMDALYDIVEGKDVGTRFIAKK